MSKKTTKTWKPATLSKAAETIKVWLYRKDMGQPRGEVWLPKDNAPDFVQEVCMAAHRTGSAAGDFMLPDDERYSMVVKALDALAEHEDPDEARDSIEAPIYTHELTAWLASRNDRHGYVDEAAMKYGVTGGPVVQQIQRGWLYEAHEVFGAVWAALEARVGDR